MLDIHSHILSGIDDGAESIEESVKLLKMLKEQGVTDVIATPHFYAMNNSIEDFKLNLKASYEKLSLLTDSSSLPNVGVGSEVFYFTGIGRIGGIKELTLCGSEYILLELPNCKMDRNIIKDITDLTDRLGLKVILAHLERYYREPHFKEVLKLVDNRSVFVQMNASSLFNPDLKRPALKLLKGNYVSFLGSDSHSSKTRPPMISNALEFITKRFGADYANQLVDNSLYLKKEIFNEGLGI